MPACASKTGDWICTKRHHLYERFIDEVQFTVQFASHSLAPVVVSFAFVFYMSFFLACAFFAMPLPISAFFIPFCSIHLNWIYDCRSSGSDWQFFLINQFQEVGQGQESGRKISFKWQQWLEGGHFDGKWSIFFSFERKKKIKRQRSGTLAAVIHRYFFISSRFSFHFSFLLRIKSLFPILFMQKFTVASF